MASAHRILLAVDDDALRHTLAEHLGAAGHSVEAWPSPSPADLVVVDDRHPEAARLAGELKAAGVPVLALGTGLAGAAVAVARPVRLGSLVSRVAELLARADTASAPLRLGRWRFDPSTRMLAGPDDARVRLTDKEAAILLHLAKAGGTVPRDRLLAEVWGYSSAVTTHTLETHIYRLRRKLESDVAADAPVLVTEDGGYRLVPS